ncbi:hypothetical protein EFB08_12555 [Rufibacter latericius]|uniref:Uncharacterized protein n=1 Tax=Rufibacter latericius TaxID=2487040 RepID=A0A3M9MLC5_9BACT|nr:hypothetical protein EFB08_12555 [Rufibacter latericius]
MFIFAEITSKRNSGDLKGTCAARAPNLSVMRVSYKFCGSKKQIFFQVYLFLVKELLLEKHFQE